MPEDWQMKPNVRTKKQLAVVKKLLEQAHHVVVATDGDREGETIGRELLDYFNWQGKIERLWLTALDDKSIRKSLNSIKKEEETRALYFAGLGRMRADWLVGINLTRALTLIAKENNAHASGVLSVGRVQTPTLAIVVSRDLEIENFSSKDYYEIIGSFSAISAKWKANEGCQYLDNENHLLNKSYARSVIDKVLNSSALVKDYSVKRKKTAPPLLFSLTKLQQMASKKYGLGAKETLDLTQNLYEKHKVITYPRTNCQYLPKSQLSEALEVLSSLKKSDSNKAFSDLVNQADTSFKTKVWNDSKISAHHAIIPTAIVSDISLMTESEFRLYDLIRGYYLMQFYPDYEYDETRIEISVADELFTSHIHVSQKIGWKKVLNLKENEPVKVTPKLRIGQSLTIEEVFIEDKKTKAPPRYTEGTLIGAMEGAHLFLVCYLLISRLMVLAS